MKGQRISTLNQALENRLNYLVHASWRIIMYITYLIIVYYFIFYVTQPSMVYCCVNYFTCRPHRLQCFPSTQRLRYGKIDTSFYIQPHLYATLVVDKLLPLVLASLRVYIKTQVALHLRYGGDPKPSILFVPYPLSTSL